ncbi:GTPase Obg, partial [Bienertia sinuspersici]
MHDAAGDVMVAMCARVKGNDDVQLGEALAAKMALEVAYDTGLRRVVLEMDCLKLVNHLKGGLVVFDILELARRCQSISFSHVSRNGNGVAHILTQQSRHYEDFRVWIGEIHDIARNA